MKAAIAVLDGTIDPGKVFDLTVEKDAVTIFCLMTPRANLSKDVLGLLEPLVEPSRHEPGCLSYDLYEGVGDDTTVVLVERWASDGAFKAHLAQPTVRQVFDTDIVDLLQSPPLAHITSTNTPSRG